jgi:hypothetical protein
MMPFREEPMETRRFDALTRRASLLTLGTAGLATVATLAPSLAADAKSKKNRKKKEKTISLQRCKRQVGPCTTMLTANCNGEPTCLKAVPCCEFLGRCDGIGFVTCTIESAVEQPT